MKLRRKPRPEFDVRPFALLPPDPVTHVELTVRGQVEALHLEPGDRIIVTLTRPVTVQQFQEIADRMNDAFPDHEVVMLAEGIRIAKQTGGES